MNLTITQIADTILDKLTADFPDYEVDDFPDDPASYQFAHPEAALLLVFKDRKFERGQFTDGSGQVNEPVWQLAQFTRYLRSNDRNVGAYQLLEATRSSLKALEIGNGNLYIAREYFYKKQSGGVWIYGQDWKHVNYYQ